ncbi:MAG: class I SAM-dependent methyltransferase [Solirubrobacteraceae bacterium]
MPEGFGGEVADLYARYRHGYPPEIVAAVSDTFGLGAADVVLDLGCGTGQLTLAVAARVRAVIGVDPEPDMLAVARRAAERSGVRNVSWILGSDRDVPELARGLGDGSLAAVTVGQALHWMDHRALFTRARSLLRPGGGIAILANGTPLWLQDSDWSRAARAFLQRWLDCELTAGCGTDEHSQQRYREDLADAGYEVHSDARDWVAALDFDGLLGGILSALSVDALPVGEQRGAFAAGLRQAVGEAERFLEPVHVALLTGRIR